MQELLTPIFEYLRGIWRFRWVALAVAWVLSLAGWFWISQLPDQYVATARVNIDTNTVLRPLLKGLAIQPSVDQRVALMSRTLLSRPNLEKVMRMTDLDLQVRSEREKEELLDRLAERLELHGDRRNRSLYTVRFTHNDRDIAKRVVQAVLTIFVESTLGEKRVDSEGAQEFLDQQIADYERRLEEAEARLADFKRKHVDSMLNDAGDYYQKLETVRAQLEKAELELKEAVNRKTRIEQQLEEQVPVLVDALNTGSPLDARIESLRAQMDKLLVKYTDRHPEVRQIQALIEELEAERRAELEAMAEDGSVGGAVQANPIYQQLQNMLASTEAEIATLRVRVHEYRQRVDELERRIDTIPRIEAQLKQLNRDYEVIRQQHAALLKRRESVRLGESADARADDVKFRVIDPPFVPSRPTEPDKLLLDAIVLVGSLGIGIGIAFVLALLRPVFVDRRRLEAVTGLPVFGAITLVLKPHERRRALLGHLAFLFAFVLLLGVFSALVLQQITETSILDRIRELGTRLL